VKGRYGWALVLVVIVSWDLVAALTNSETLTWTFRRAVSQTAWRWPVMVLVLLIVVHLFLPDDFAAKYDPLDRLYQHVDPVHQPKQQKPSPKRPPSTGSQQEPH
jgi:hypothetical protein